MIATRALSLRAGKRTLVDGLDWQVSAGECWAVIGRNGAGKSSLLHVLAGVAPPAAGEVVLADRPLAQWRLTDRARLCAYLPQSRQDSFGYRVRDAVLAARFAHAPQAYWDRDADLAAADAALAALDVLDLAERDLRSLSGGERQRVAIAALLAQDAPTLLLDEPAAALDLPHQVALMHLLAQQRRQHDRAIVMVTHDPNLAAQAATHALLLMGDGTWHAGPWHQTMTTERLGRCLGHRIEVIAHGDRHWFIPSEHP